MRSSISVCHMQAYIGLPGEGARYKILHSCVVELARSGLIQNEPGVLPPSYLAATAACEALPDMYARFGVPQNAAGDTNDSMHDIDAAQAMAGLQLSDLRLEPAVLEELAASRGDSESTGADSLGLARLGIQLRCSFVFECATRRAKLTRFTFMLRTLSSICSSPCFTNIEQQPVAVYCIPCSTGFWIVFWFCLAASAHLLQNTCHVNSMPAHYTCLVGQVQWPGMILFAALRHSSQACLHSLCHRVRALYCRAIASKCEGHSGRTLRKLPFLAVAYAQESQMSTVSGFLRLLDMAAVQEASDRAQLNAG
jgi:hypothetical protein